MGPVTIGCLNTFYQSVANLDNSCLSSEKTKEILLQPKNSSEDYCSTVKLNIDDTKPTEYFICVKFEHCSYRSLTTSLNKNCGHCGTSLTRLVSVEPFYNGFVNNVATFVITDNLNVIPNSSGYTSLSLIQNSGIKSISLLKEMTVNVTKEKILDLLKCSLLSKSPLTDLFLGEKKLSLERSLFLSTDFKHYNHIKITLNLVIRKSDKKILYAQGEKDFAEILLSFLMLPLGAIVRVLGENCCLGSIDNLYKSIVNLDDRKYLLSKQVKKRLVYPNGVLHFNSQKFLLSCPSDDCSVYLYYFYYKHQSCKKSTIDDKIFISKEFRRDEKKGSEVRLYYDESTIGCHVDFVKGPAMYVVTDDLILAPSSPISALYLINQLGTSLSDVKEKVVTIGFNECLSILKASLTSTSALTNGLRHLLTDVKEEK